MRHERDFRIICLCSTCDGTGNIEIGASKVPCPECAGTGDVVVNANREDLD